MKEYTKTILRALTILVLLTLCVHSVHAIFDHISAQGLKRYFSGFIEPHNIKIEEISCKMHKPRAGYFLFQIDNEEFLKLKEAIGLIELTEDSIFKKREHTTYVRYDIKYEIEEAIHRCDLVKGFEFKNAQYDEKITATQ